MATVIALTCAGAASAQDRAPAARQALLDLANVIGESHALRWACQGDGDQYWRTRMFRLIEVEAPDQAFQARLSQAFNAGFATGRASFPRCSKATRAEAAAAARRGRDLAARLAAP